MKLKKVLIVDDEQLIRIGLLSLLEWESYGYVIIGDASNGEEALDKIEKLKPDIVLVDLKMDPIDGFEVIKRGIERNSNTKFIALSNYNDFDSARKAMKLGASDYIFKFTLKAEDLIKVLNEVSAEIIVSEEQGTYQAECEQIWSVKENVLKHILDYGEEASKVLSDIPLEISFEKGYRVLFLKINDFIALRKAGNYPNLLLVKNTLEKVILELLERQFFVDTFRYRDSEFVVVLNSRFQDSFDHIKRAFIMLNNYSKQYYGFTLCGGVSNICKGKESFNRALQESRQFMQRCFLSDEQLIQENDMEEKLAEEIEETYSIHKFEEFIKMGDLSMAFKNLLQFMDDMDENKKCRGIIIKQHMIKIIQVILFGMIKYRIEIGRVVDKNGVCLDHVMSEYDTFESARQSIVDISAVIKSEFSQVGETRKRKEIAAAEIYMEEYLNEDITVSKMAKLVSMSESRFAHVFKEEVGVSFIEYVNQLRIDKAIGYLLHSDMQINEIAIAVGINNSNYFSTLFRKRTGKTPLEFRKSKIAEK